MRSLVLRTLTAVVVAGAGLGVAASPAAADAPSSFRLSAGSVVGYGNYQNMMGNPERPVPPFRVTGTLVGRSLFRCAVIQVARSGPTDGIEWETFGRHCGPGRTNVRAQASYLFRGVKPPVRLCAGRSVADATRGRQCDTYNPAL